MAKKTRSIVLCGPVCSGKTTAATALSKLLGLPVVAAREAIERTAGRSPLQREELQAIGRELERDTPGRWLADAVDLSVGAGKPAIVDAGRTYRQIAALRDREPGAVVLHLSAAVEVRRSRYTARASASDSDVPFDVLAATPIEQQAEALAGVSDVALDTSHLTPPLVVDRLAAVLHGPRN